jgi:hypothetical protein
VIAVKFLIVFTEDGVPAFVVQVPAFTREVLSSVLDKLPVASSWRVVGAIIDDRSVIGRAFVHDLPPGRIYLLKNRELVEGSFRMLFTKKFEMSVDELNKMLRGEGGGE